MRIFYYLLAVIPDSLTTTEADLAFAKEIKYKLRMLLADWFKHTNQRKLDILSHFQAEQKFYKKLDEIRKKFQSFGNLEDVIFIPTDQ